MIQSIIQPKSPNGLGWKRMPDPPAWSTLGFAGTAWLHVDRLLYVISAVEVASDKNDIDKGPEYHISISKNGVRCDSNEANFVRDAFGMLDAEEDNHVPFGKVRNFWKPVAENLIGHECACKDSENAIVEDKGDYVWREAP
jgi:hypothetical protein